MLNVVAVGEEAAASGKAGSASQLLLHTLRRRSLPLRGSGCGGAGVLVGVRTSRRRSGRARCRAAPTVALGSSAPSLIRVWLLRLEMRKGGRKKRAQQSCSVKGGKKKNREMGKCSALCDREGEW